MWCCSIQKKGCIRSLRKTIKLLGTITVYIVYVIESAAYWVVFTSCLCENPNERVRAFDTNNE